VLAAAAIVAAGLTATACGSEAISQKALNDKPNIANGAKLFSARCSGCHTMDVVGAQGGATRVHDRERPDGPNFNVRRETQDSVLYAIRNGGFSGAIMPENIVVGKQANDVAAFVSKYAGGPRKGNDITPQSQPAAGGGDTTSTQQDTTSTQQDTTSTQQDTTSTQQDTTSTQQTTPEAGTTSTGGGGTQQAAAQGKQIFTTNCALPHAQGRERHRQGRPRPRPAQARPADHPAPGDERRRSDARVQGPAQARGDPGGLAVRGERRRQVTRRPAPA